MKSSIKEELLDELLKGYRQPGAGTAQEILCFSRCSHHQFGKSRKSPQIRAYENANRASELTLAVS
jgi:hypothetical protein